HPSYPFFFITSAVAPVIYTLSLHDALPIYEALSMESISTRKNEIAWWSLRAAPAIGAPCGYTYSKLQFISFQAGCLGGNRKCAQDRKSTRLNSSHSQISYAVFCLKKKKIRS